MGRRRKFDTVGSMSSDRRRATVTATWLPERCAASMTAAAHVGKTRSSVASMMSKGPVVSCRRCTCGST
jgi:hypothetical protein